MERVKIELVVLFYLLTKLRDGEFCKKLITRLIKHIVGVSPPVFPN
jgi:hypothetical protein